MALRTIRCQIEDLADWHPQLFLEPHIVACVAVLSRYSDSPASIEVECQNISKKWTGKQSGTNIELSWSEESAAKAEQILATIQTNPLVEMAAAAIAFVVVHKVEYLGKVEVTRHGERADYLLSENQVVLEISGTENLSELKRRHREKVAQALRNPFDWDAYTVVCAFSDEGHRVLFSRGEFQGV